MRRRTATIPCRVFPGAFSHEYEVQVDPPDSVQPVFAFAPVTATRVSATVDIAGVLARLVVVLVDESAEHYIIDLPGETHPIGPRLRVPKHFVTVDR